MAIPNTTPTPNELFNGEMKKMRDVELRIVLIVTRATLGWVIDPKTGMRKEEDWLSTNQIEERVGRGHSSISLAINSCIKHKWIEARDEKGNLLDKPEKRERKKKIFFRLGNVFLNRLIQKVDQTDPESGSALIQKVDATKETLTKEEIHKNESLVSEKSETRGNFNFTKYLKQMQTDKRTQIQIIALYWLSKEMIFENYKQTQAAIKRDVRASSLLMGYSLERIKEVMEWLKQCVDFKWTLETVHKYIDEKLETIKVKEIETIKVPDYARSYAK